MGDSKTLVYAQTIVCLLIPRHFSSSQSELHDFSCFGAVCSYPLGKHHEEKHRSHNLKQAWANSCFRVVGILGDL